MGSPPPDPYDRRTSLHFPWTVELGDSYFYPTKCRIIDFGYFGVQEVNLGKRLKKQNHKSLPRQRFYRPGLVRHQREIVHLPGGSLSREVILVREESTVNILGLHVSLQLIETVPVCRSFVTPILSLGPSG